MYKILRYFKEKINILNILHTKNKNTIKPKKLTLNQKTKIYKKRNQI